MNIFIIGLPKSGRSTLAKALTAFTNFYAIDTTAWLKESFRNQNLDEHDYQYNDSRHTHIINLLKANPNCVIHNIKNNMELLPVLHENYTIIFDGLFSPTDFTKLFDPSKDMVIFLNCSNNVAEYRDYESIGVSVIRDFCFWLSATDQLSGSRWLEYNFAIPGVSSSAVKKLSHKNTVFITKSLDKTISHVIDYINPLTL